MVGILALQGDFNLHAELLRGLGVPVREVRRPSELEGCSGLILPGGESTTIRRLLRLEGLIEPLLAFAAERPLLGTCAGCILMATGLGQAYGVEPFALVDIDVDRNGYGTQIDSFEAAPELKPGLLANFKTPTPTLNAAFIRAPRITRVGDDVEILATLENEPVAIRQGHHMALTFHPEVTGDIRWHQMWLGGWLGE